MGMICLIHRDRIRIVIDGIIDRLTEALFHSFTRATAAGKVVVIEILCRIV
jgi:hypothetical protein